MSNVRKIGICKRFGLNVLVICLAKLYELIRDEVKTIEFGSFDLRVKIQTGRFRSAEQFAHGRETFHRQTNIVVERRSSFVHREENSGQTFESGARKSKIRKIILQLKRNESSAKISTSRKFYLIVTKQVDDSIENRIDLQLDGAVAIDAIFQRLRRRIVENEQRPETRLETEEMPFRTAGQSADDVLSELNEKTEENLDEQKGEWSFYHVIIQFRVENRLFERFGQSQIILQDQAERRLTKQLISC